MFGYVKSKNETTFSAITFRHILKKDCTKLLQSSIVRASGARGEVHYTFGMWGMDEQALESLYDWHNGRFLNF